MWNQNKREETGVIKLVGQMDGSPVVLLLEDDEDDRIALRHHLEQMGLIVHDTPSLLTARENFEQNNYSIVLIHVSHAQLESLEICRWIREASNVPILMLTKRGEFIDNEMVIAAGADDYISKPIQGKILISRVTQQLKRGQTYKNLPKNILTWGQLQIDLSKRSFMVGDTFVALTNTEFRILHLLMESPHSIFSRKQILEAIGVLDGIGTDHVIDSHTSRLRRKIRENGGPDVISVVRSVGFRLADPS